MSESLSSTKENKWIDWTIEGNSISVVYLWYYWQCITCFQIDRSIRSIIYFKITLNMKLAYVHEWEIKM